MESFISIFLDVPMDFSFLVMLASMLSFLELSVVQSKDFFSKKIYVFKNILRITVRLIQ